MRFAKHSAWAGVTFALLIAIAATQGQTGSRTASAENASAEKTFDVLLQDSKKKKAKKLRGRLPNNYGKVGVTSAQRKNIYQIQATYNEKIDALEAQIADLKSKRDAEILAVLKPEQKKKLEALQEATRKKREARKKKRDKEKEKE